MWPLTRQRDRRRFFSSSRWTPAQLGSALALWLDASDAGTVVLNGSTVSQWSDKSGNNKNAVQATASLQPAYSLTGFNGLRPGLAFDGVNDFMTVAGLPIIAQPMSVAIVMNDYVGGTGDANLYRSSGAGAVGYRASGTSWTIFAGVVLNSAEAYIVTPTIRHDIYNGSSSQIRRDGTAYITGDAGNNGLVNAGNSFNIGAGTAGGSPSSVKMGEFLILNRTLTTGETQSLEGYLAWKWSGWI
jgi:hypothetical protein